MEAVGGELRACAARLEAELGAAEDALEALAAGVRACKAAIVQAAADDDNNSNEDARTVTRKRKLAVADLGASFEAAATMAKLRAGNKAMHAALGRLGKATDKILSPEDLEIIRCASKEEKAEEAEVADLLSLAIVEHYLHSDRIDLARDLAAEMAHPLDPVRAGHFEEIHRIARSLGDPKVSSGPDRVSGQTVDVTRALAWARSHAEHLSEPGSPQLVFELQKLHFLQLVERGDSNVAVAYARKEFPLGEGGRHAPEVQALMGKLVFLEPDAVSTQRRLACERFRSDASLVYGVPSESPLVSSLKAGRHCIEKLRKFFRVILARRAALSPAPAAAADHCSAAPAESGATDSHAATRNAYIMAVHRAARARRSSGSSALADAASGPVKGDLATSSRSWVDLEQLPMNADLDARFDYHSVIVCPVSKEQTTPDNEPMLLHCGHVIANASMKRIIRPAGQLKCPTCQVEQNVFSAIQLYV